MVWKFVFWGWFVGSWITSVLALFAMEDAVRKGVLSRGDYEEMVTTVGACLVTGFMWPVLVGLRVFRVVYGFFL